MLYVFTGQEASSKDAYLKRIRQESLPKETDQFNYDTLYAKELTLLLLQEKLLCLPVRAGKRLIVIKEAQVLKEECREFLLRYASKPYPGVILVLDMSWVDRKDEFFASISKKAKVIPFKETIRPTAFTLSDFISSRRPDYALRVLNELLIGGEKPERILGGLRYAFEKNEVNPAAMRRKLKLLLNCDMEIKTGRLKPVFALEKLVVSLCGTAKPLH